MAKQFKFVHVDSDDVDDQQKLNISHTILKQSSTLPSIGIFFVCIENEKLERKWKNILRQDVNIIDSIQSRNSTIDNFVIFTTPIHTLPSSKSTIETDKLKSHIRRQYQIYVDCLLHYIFIRNKTTLLFELSNKSHVDDSHESNTKVINDLNILSNLAKRTNNNTNTTTPIKHNIDEENIKMLLQNYGRVTNYTLNEFQQPFLVRKSASSKMVHDLNFSENTKLLFPIRNHKMIINSTYVKFHLLRNPNLIKILYAFNECSDEYSDDDNDGIQSIDSFLLALMSEFWNINRVANIYYISRCIRQESKENEKPNESLIYTFDPFYISTHNNKSVYGKLVKTISSDPIAMKYIQFGLELRNLNRYPLTLVFFPTTMAFLKLNKLNTTENVYKKNISSYFGTDSMILKEFIRMLNFTPDLLPTSDNKYYGFRDPNGKFNGGLGDVLHRRAEFIMNGYFVKDYETRSLEFTASTMDEKLCIIVRKSDLIPKSLVLFRCFSHEVWMAMGITVTLVSIGYSLVLKLNPRIQKNTLREIQNNNNDKQTFNGNNTLKLYLMHEKLTNLIKSPFRIIAVLLCAPAEGIGTSTYERVFISICFLWSLNMSGAFQGKLIDVYTNPGSYPDINTLDELDKSGIPIMVRHQGLAVDVFGTEQPGTPLGNLRKGIKTTDDDDLNGKITKFGKLAGLGRITDFPRTEQKYIRDDGVSLLHKLPECPKSYTIAYLVPKSSIFREIISSSVNRFLENGLITKYQHDTSFAFQLETGLQNRRYILSTQIQLTISHLQLAFIILGIGIIFSSITLMLELLTSRY